MDIAEIRRENMLALIDKFKTQAQFADAIGTPASYISQLKKGVKSSGARVTMGNDLARQIEVELKLPYGYMDRQNATTIHNQFNNNGVVSGSVSQSIVNNYGECLPNDDGWRSISNNDMFPTFVIGDRVLVDENREPQAGNYVLVECEGSEVLRKYRPKGFDENGTQYTQLVADNEDYPVIDSRHQIFKILGVAVEHKRKLI